MLTYDQALAEILRAAKPLQPQKLPLVESLGHVLSSPAIARWDMPLCDNSAMDGFALAVKGSGTPSPLKVIGSSFAGHPYAGRVNPGEAVQITTGACLPEGTDTVVPVEETTLNNEWLSLNSPIKKGQHVRYRGEEFRENDELVAAGVQVNAGEVGLLACAGVDQVEAYPKPKVAIFSTGDELVELGQVPGPGQIVNSNLQYLIARIRECHCIPVPLGIGLDSSEDLDKLLDQARNADLLLSTGGVSVGEKDLVQQTLQQRGFERIFWKVAIKPGKPVLFGLLDKKPFLGLPGNPAATAATFELFAVPALRIMAGLPDPLPVRLRATLSDKVKGGGKRQSFLWGRLKNENGGLLFEPSFRQGSGQNSSVQGAHALLSVEIGSPDLSAGSETEVFLMRVPPGEQA